MLINLVAQVTKWQYLILGLIWIIEENEVKGKLKAMGKNGLHATTRSTLGGESLRTATKIV